MRYSNDLRKRVLDFIEAGGSKTEASKRFSVSRAIIYRWLAAEDPFTYEKPGPRGPRALSAEALRKHATDFPDQTLAERANHFEVSTFCIWYTLKKMGFTRKKKTIGYKERCPQKRQTYQKQLQIEQQNGKSLVFVDECSFVPETFRPYAYAPIGVPVCALVPGQKHPRNEYDSCTDSR